MKPLIHRVHFQLSDWFVLAVCCALMTVAIAASLVWFQQGMAYSATVGIEAASKSRDAFGCRADAALAVTVVTAVASLLLRLAHLRVTRRRGIRVFLIRGLLEQATVSLVMWTTMAVFGSPHFVSRIVWALIERRCGAE